MFVQPSDSSSWSGDFIEFDTAKVIEPATFFQWKDDPKFKGWFDSAKIGDSYAYTYPSGCNTCSGQVIKVSDTEVRDMGIFSCTLMNCYLGETIKVK